MDANDIADLMKRLGIKHRKDLAEALEISPNRLGRMIDGRSSIPLHISLAAAALVAGLPPWPGELAPERVAPNAADLPTVLELRNDDGEVYGTYRLETPA